MPEFARGSLADAVLHTTLKVFLWEWQAHAFVEGEFIGRDFEILFAINAREDIHAILFAVCACFYFLRFRIGKVIFGQCLVVLTWRG